MTNLKSNRQYFLHNTLIFFNPYLRWGKKIVLSQQSETVKPSYISLLICSTN